METKERTYFNSRIRAVANHFNQRRAWIRCPRCIGGNMYHEDNGEYVCKQCGCSYNPDITAKKSGTENVRVNIPTPTSVEL